MRFKLILNPIAGRGRGERMKEQILARLKQSGCEHDISFTGQKGAGKLLAKQAAADGYDIVIAAGGDGTVNEVVNGIAGSQSAIGVVPLGTGNDFAMMIGMPKDPLASLDRILQGRMQTVDLCRVNDRYFASSVGAGFDGEVAYTANHRFKHLRGMVVYILSVFTTVFFYRPRHVRLTIDGTTREQEITLLAAVNSRSYGGGMLVAPDAVVDDGLFDICLADKMSPFRIMYMLPRFIKGKHLTMREVTMYKGREISLESTTPIYYQVDGEFFEDTRLVMHLIPHGLKVAGAAFKASAVPFEAAVSLQK